MRRLIALLLAILLLLSIGCRSTAGTEPESPMRFAFVRGGDLWLWANGEERRLTNGPPVESPRFSPTGRYVAYQQANQLQVIGTGGNGPWNVPDVDLTAMRPASWHPTDNRLAVTRQGGTWIYRITADGVEQDGLAADGWTDPLWTPDGKLLTISRVETSPASPHAGTVLTATISPAHGEPQILLADPFEPPSTGCGKGARPLAWSPDGDYLLLVRPGWTPSIAADFNEWLLLDPATGMTAQPGASPNTRWAVWSPTEPVLAYVHGPDRVASHGKALRLIAPPWTESRTITPERYADREPAWSPGGRYLAFVRSLSQGPPAPAQAIYLAEVETGATRLIKGSEGGSGPFWGKEGTLFWLTTGAPDFAAPATARPPAHLRHGRGDLPSPLLTFDQPSYYYGQWNWPQVLGAWIGPRGAPPTRTSR